MLDDQVVPITAEPAAACTRSRRAALGAGAVIGLLGGLGGSEFRLPLPIWLFGFVALQALIMNSATSLVVVATALPARLAAVPVAELAPRWYVAANAGAAHGSRAARLPEVSAACTTLGG